MNSESNTTSANAAQLKSKAWYRQSAEEVLKQLGSSASGLSAQEVIKRLEADGPNELKEGKHISPLQIFIGQFKSLIIWILIVAGIISGVLGETVDAIAILAIVILNAVIGFYQEFSAEKSIAALKNRQQYTECIIDALRVRKNIISLTRQRTMSLRGRTCSSPEAILSIIRRLLRRQEQRRRLATTSRKVIYLQTLRGYLARHHPLRAELRGTFVAI